MAVVEAKKGSSGTGPKGKAGKKGGKKVKAGKKVAKLNDRSLWPRPKNKLDAEPHFLFLVTPPNSGSTALVKMLNSSHRTTLLHDNGEAQWLVPGLSARKRWDRDMPVNYDSVKAVWLKQFQYLRECVGGVDVVIEKSPASLQRFDAIRALFSDTSVIASNRNPYANIASKGFRYGKFAERSAEERLERLGPLTRKWQEQSREIAAIIDRHGCPLMTYEAFCENPAALIGMLSLPEGVTDTIDVEVKVSVKDYEAQGITNQNAKQVAMLTESEQALIRDILAEDMPLMERFGYSLDPAEA